MPPGALRPVGVALVDKPAGPSSFAIVGALRRVTRARTGHAGTLDPFATGLLVLLSGAATRLAPCFVGLDKRYVTDIDLTSTTSTGDPEGEELENAIRPLAQPSLEEALEGLRGEIELRIPAASAVKIGGERAYKLARRGVAVEMPVRRSLVHSLEVIAYTGRDRASRAPRQLGHLRAVDRPGDRRALHEPAADRRRAVRRRGVADGRRGGAPAGGRRAGAASGRGAGAGARGGPRRRAGTRPAGRGSRRVNVARSAADLPVRPRAVAIGTFDGVHVGHRTVVRAAVAAGRGGALHPTVVTFHPHPRTVLGKRVELLATLERRLELLEAAGVEDVLVVQFRPEIAALEPADFARQYLLGIGAEVVVAGTGFHFGKGRAGDLELLRELGLDAREVPLVEGVSSTRIRQFAHAGEVENAARLLGRPLEVEGRPAGSLRARPSTAPSPRWSTPGTPSACPGAATPTTTGRWPCRRRPSRPPGRRSAPSRASPSPSATATATTAVGWSR